MFSVLTSVKLWCVQDTINDLFFFSSFTDYICGDKCSYWYDDCTCGYSQLHKYKFCCIPSNASCSGIEYKEVNCPIGTVNDLDQKCGNGCPISTRNNVAISTILDNYECLKSDRFSKVSSGSIGSKDFKEYCYKGETCGSSTTTVKFKQCYCTEE